MLVKLHVTVKNTKFRAMEMQQWIRLLLWNVVQLQNMSFTFQQYKNT